MLLLLLVNYVWHKMHNCHKCSVDLSANCIFVLAVFAVVQICLWCFGKLQICCNCFVCECRIEEMWRRKILESAVWRQNRTPPSPKPPPRRTHLTIKLQQALTSLEDANASVVWNCESHRWMTVTCVSTEYGRERFWMCLSISKRIETNQQNNCNVETNADAQCNCI